MPSLEILLAVMRRGDTMRVRGKIVKLSGSLVPVTSALPPSVAHVSLLCCVGSKLSPHPLEDEAGLYHAVIRRRPDA